MIAWIQCKLTQFDTQFKNKIPSNDVRIVTVLCQVILSRHHDGVLRPEWQHHTTFPFREALQVTS